MKKTGYLLLAVLNCSLAFGTATPALVPIASVPGSVDTFLKEHNVALIPTEKRNMLAGMIDFPFLSYLPATFIFAKSAVSMVDACATNLTGSCVKEHLSVGTCLFAIALPLAVVVTWHWYLKYCAFFYSSEASKKEFRKCVVSVLTTKYGAGTTFTQLALTSFLRDALVEYKKQYRSAGLFDKGVFEREILKY